MKLIFFHAFIIKNLFEWKSDFFRFFWIGLVEKLYGVAILKIKLKKKKPYFGFLCGSYCNCFVIGVIILLELFFTWCGNDIFG